VLAKLNEDRSQALAYTTVMTVMARLADKGILTRRSEGRGYAYEAAAPDEAGIAVQGLLRQFGDAAIASLADQARADPKLLRRLERLLREDR
jgi:predicted transcriptional regulator